MDNFSRSSNNMFVAQVLNRAHNRRKNEKWVDGRLHDPESLFLPVWQSKLLVTDGETPLPVALGWSEVQSFANGSEALFLGEKNGRCYFAVEIAATEDVTSLGRFRDLRALGPLLSKEDGALLAYAKTLTYWHGRNRFCSACGSRSRIAEGGQIRICTNPDCGILHFPRTDPAIIVLIRSGEKCLLGRQAVWPGRMYSVIAGFVAPGESAEAAVLREALEETGLKLRNVNYHSSQPWPFPCSLMLGFTADADGEEICLGDKELEDARWLTRKDLQENVESGAMRLPSAISIAYHLIEDWFDSESRVRMRDLRSPGVFPDRTDSEGRSDRK
ncbi:MAG: NAD(+) diphosphatase [Syntrophobacteraceae bacterium]